MHVGNQKDTQGSRQQQHVAVSIEATRLPELRRSDRGDLLRYLEQVRRYDRQAESVALQESPLLKVGDRGKHRPAIR